MTAALALARNGFRVTVLEQSERLEETGAGIQLSPNAARTLIDLGLAPMLRPHVVAPTALRVLSATTGLEIVRMPLGEAEQRYGAPYWVIHRGDLQAALATAIAGRLDVIIKLGMQVGGFRRPPQRHDRLGARPRRPHRRAGLGTYCRRRALVARAPASGARRGSRALPAALPGAA